MPVTYRDAGVSIDRGNALVERIKPLARRTRIKEVLDDVGGFAGICGLPTDIEDPVLVSGTDGVGTKLLVAIKTGRHDTIGQDLVAMCVNDVITTGARPLFFLDYFGCGELDVGVAESVISGVAEGCLLAGCALLGGETAELPGMYKKGEYDLAGFAVGVASRRALLGKERVRFDDELIAIASSGLHSNGYSLARRVLEQERGLLLGDFVEALGTSLADALLRPTRIYARAVAELGAALGEDLHALSHITGGGVVENLPRALPEGAVAEVALPVPAPAIFELIQKDGLVEASEMQRTFNLGIGMIAVVAQGAAPRAVTALTRAGETAWRCGRLASAAAEAPARVELMDAP